MVELVNNMYHLDSSVVETCQRKFNGLLCYLAVRNNNVHVAGGMGGNNFQLFVLGEYQHHLSLHSEHIARRGGILEWDANWLVTASLDDVRRSVNKVLGTHLPGSYALSLLLDDGAGQLRERITRYGELFPNLSDHVKNPYSSLSLSWQEQMILGMVFSDDIAELVDNGQPPDDIRALYLLEMPFEIVLFAIRTRIGINRLIKHSMDEHPTFGPVIERINRLVMDNG